ncbi:MAG TPA: hypothetical protein VN700_17110 [Vicinamibacterales bacterium]|nr:hypothetical protein [Vicinamibacterales bacterium]
MMFSRSRPLLVVALISVAIGAAVGWWRWSAQNKPQPSVKNEVRRIRAELEKELVPIALSNCEWIRVGSANDGGYAMCGNLLEGIETAYSYGIGGNDDWGCQISTTYKVPVHQYDCFNPASPPCKRGGDLRLNVECIGPRQETQDGRSFDTLASHIAKNGDTGKKKVVKIDIEGAEWQSILAAPDELFDSIVQMPMELHGTDAQEVLDGLRKLKRHFHLVSVHFNNWRCSEDFAPFPNFAYQVLLVNKKAGIPGDPPAGAAPLASALAPDKPGAPECVTTVGRPRPPQ